MRNGAWPRTTVFLSVGVAALAVVLAVLVGVLVLSDDSDGAGGDGPPADGETPAPSTGGAATGDRGGEEPLLAESPDHYTLLVEELEQPFTVEQETTFLIGPEGYSLTSLYSDPAQARESLTEWGFAGAYFATYQPVGLTAGVVVGRHYLRIELLSFETIEGAKAAWERAVTVHDIAPNAEGLEVDPVGNQWLGSRVEGALIENTELTSVFERTAFRRGNLIAIVQVAGARDLLAPGLSQPYSEAIDAKALGDAEAVAPTPFGANIPTPPIVEEGTPEPIN